MEPANLMQEAPTNELTEKESNNLTESNGISKQINLIGEFSENISKLVNEWKASLTDYAKSEKETLAELDKILKQLQQYETSLHQKIIDTKENVRKLLLKS